MDNYHIDLHCHPTLKPFGQSFGYKDENGISLKGKNTTKNVKRSIWHRDMPKGLDKPLNFLLGATKFRQSDFRTFSKGNGRIMIIAMGPMEKGLVYHNVNDGFHTNFYTNLATGIGKNRIIHLRKMKDYFNDLLMEYEYIKEIQNQSVIINKKKFTYKIINNYDEIEHEELQSTIYIILSIEGAHVFNTGLQLANREKADPKEVVSNIRIMKKEWDHTPFFITLAHHFNNELCGHAKSFKGPNANRFNQHPDINNGISELGWEVINELMSDQNGKRILIDLKHMNSKSRYEFYSHFSNFNNIETTNSFEIDFPLIVSHGAVNKINNPSEIENNKIRLKNKEINFFNDEIELISRSKGIFGIQLDKRRLMTRKQINKIPKYYLKSKSKRLTYSSRFLWNQIKYIGLTLNERNLPAWDIQAIGSDFDGIINPLNGFWTSKEIILSLQNKLEKHASKFMNSDKSEILKENNKISPEKIINKFLSENANNFLKNHFV